MNPFYPGTHVSIDGKGFHAVSGYQTVEGGGYRLRLRDYGPDGDDDEVVDFDIEVYQDSTGAWLNEDNEVVAVVDAAPAQEAQLDLFA